MANESNARVSLRAALIACRTLRPGASLPPEVGEAVQLFEEELSDFEQVYGDGVKRPAGAPEGMSKRIRAAGGRWRNAHDAKGKLDGALAALLMDLLPFDQLVQALSESIAALSALESAQWTSHAANRRALSWLWRLAPGVGGGLIGVILLGLLDSCQRRTVQVDIDEHLRLAKQAATAASTDATTAGKLIDGIKAIVPPRGAKSPSPPTVGDARMLALLLAEGQTNAASALDALNRVQAVEHDDGLAGASGRMVRVGDASGANDLLKFMATQFEQKAVPTAVSVAKDTTVLGAWITAATSNVEAMEETAHALCLAASDLDLLCVRPVDAVRAKETLGEVIFDGRSNLRFVGKVFFACAYLFVGAGALVVLATLFGLQDAKATIEEIVRKTATGEGRLVGILWALVAPVGLAAALATGVAVAKPALKPEASPDDPSHLTIIAPPPELSTLQRLLEHIGDSVHVVDSTAAAVAKRAQ